MSRESTMNALMRHHENQLKKDKGPQRRNKKPEKKVEEDCLKWGRHQGWSLDIIESRGERDQYGTIAVKAGFSDCVGNDYYGRAVYIEFKAPGRAVFSSVRPAQMAFLEKKIKSNAFAVVVDSAELLAQYYNIWCSTGMASGRDEARKYLEQILPKARPVYDSSVNLFHDGCE